MSSNIIRRFELIPFHFGGVDGFTSWKTSFELLDSSNDGNDSGNSFLWVLVFFGSHELLDSSIEHKKGFVFITNALEESKEIEVTSEGFEHTLFDLSELDLVWISSKLNHGLLSKDGLGSSLTNINSELLPVLVVVSIN